MSRYFSTVFVVAVTMLLGTAGHAAAFTPGNILTSPPATENVGTNMATLLLQSSASGTGYFTLLKGAGTACGTCAQVKVGQDSAGNTAPYHGSLPLAANTTGRYTVRNLLQSTAYTICFTADSPAGQNLQASPATAHLTTADAVVLTNPDWGVVGVSGFSSGSVNNNMLAFAADGTPYLAYTDGSSGKATVMKFDGTAWVAVGNTGFSGGAAYSLVLAIAPDGSPYVAFNDGSVDGGATVMRFNGASWESVGSAGFTFGGVSYLSLAFTLDGSPCIAFREDWSSTKLTVMSFTNGVWGLVGDAGFSDGFVFGTSLATAPDGTLYVAYGDYVNDNRVVVKKFNGATWSEVGQTGGTSVIPAGYISLVFSAEGVPYVSFTELNDPVYSTYNMKVLKFDGSSWTNVGSTLLTTDYLAKLSLALSPNTTPYVAYRDWTAGGNATVMSFSEGAWSPVGTKGFSAGDKAVVTSLAFSPSGIPFVSYMNYTDDKATVMKLKNGTTTTLAQDVIPTDLEQQVTFTATVSPLTATGTVTFKDGNSTLCLAVPLDVNNQAVCAVSSLTAGTHAVTASYSGDAGFAGSGGSVDHLVQGKVLNLTVAGTGNDMVTITRNPPDGHPALNCGVGPCSVVFPSNAVLTLTPVLDLFSVSAAWDGPCAGSTACSVTMDTDKSQVATFSLTPVANITVYAPYPTLAAAVSGARPSGDEIRMLGIPLGDVVDVVLDKSLTLSGGWLNYQTGDIKPTFLNTTLTIQAGDSVVERTVVKTKLTVKGGTLRVTDVTMQQ